MRRRWMRVVSMAVGLAAGVSASPAAARDFVDQQQTAVDFGAPQVALGGATHQRLTQIFTAGVSQPLLAVDLPLSSCTFPQPTLTIDIRSVEGGLPGIFLFSHTVVAAAQLFATYSGSMYSYYLQDPVSLVAGQQYAIVLTTDGDCRLHSGPASDSYAGGDSYANDDRVPLFPQVWTALTPNRDLPFRTRVGRRADVQLTFDDAQGMWRVSPFQQWTFVHPVTPVAMVSGNFDADPIDDVVVDFGSAGGLWILYNRTTWQTMHPLGAVNMVASDFDNDGRDEVAVSFAGYGLFIWDGGLWTQIRAEVPRKMVAGEVAFGIKLVADLDSDGLSYWDGNQWSVIAPLHPSTLVTADLQGFGSRNVVAGFEGLGLWRWQFGQWVRLRAQAPKYLAVADLNRNGARDLVVDFGPNQGIWVLRDGSQWTWLHIFTSDGIAVADRDGSGHDDLLIDFGAYGLWQYTNDQAWTALHPFSPAIINARRYD